MVKSLAARLHLDFEALPPQPVDQHGELARVLGVFDQQHLPLALDVGEGGGAVVLRHGVVLGAVGDEAGLVGVEVRRRRSSAGS